MTASDSSEMETWTIADTPPGMSSHQRRSRWEELFAECRNHAMEWRRIIEPMRRSTAAQVSSDLRSVHRRDPKKVRLRGLLPGDQWEAVWGSDPRDPDPEHFYVWLRYAGQSSGEHPAAEDCPPFRLTESR